MTSPVIQFKRGAFANLPGLQAGEPALTTDTFEFYVGIDSTTTNNKFFGSHRYWTREGTSTGSGVNLVEGSANGSSFITLKSPDSLAGITTFTLPSADGSNGQFLKTNGSGTLSFADVSTNLSIAGGTGTDTISLLTDTLTFAGTANEIETIVTNNQVQIGLPNDVIVGNALTVTGPAQFNGTVNLGNATGDTVTVVGLATFTTSDVYISNSLFVGGIQITGGSIVGQDITTRNFTATGVSTFVGAVTFQGGTITLGDATTDNVVFTADVNSNITPNTDATYDLGNESQRWRNASFSGIVTATTFSGNASSADQVKTVTASNNAANYYVTFVDSHNGSATNESVYTDDGIYYNPGTNTFTTQHALFTGDVTVQGTLTGTATTATRAQNVDIAGVAVNQDYNLVLSVGSGNSKALGVDAELLYNPNTNTFKVGTGVGITQFSASVSTGSSASSVPTSSAVIDYVGTQIAGVDLTTTIAGDSGTGSFNTSQTLTVAGTAGEIETSASGQTITVGLPDAVVVGTSLSAPTIKVATLQHSNATQAATIDSSGNITAAQNLTVSGNLYVNGSTTQVNTAAMTVEDRTIELGVVDGSAPSSTTTWDLGVLFNYYDGSAKKSALVWEQADARFKLGSVISDGGGTGNSNPQITFTTYAPLEIGALWVNDCAGQSQVISCSGGTRKLENITIDAGTF